jgi:MGT family glycosyltransferase
MARILLAGVPTYGQANPTWPLTAALVEAGHQVDYLMPEAFRVSVENCGATLLPYASFLRGKAVAKPIQALGARLLFDELTERLIRIGNDYDAVVATGLQPQFAEIEKALHVPVVRFSPMPFQNDRTVRELMAHAKALPAPVRAGLRTPALRRAASQLIGRAVLGNHGRDVLDLLGPQSSTLNLSVSTAFLQPHADDFTDCTFMGATSTVSAKDPSFPLARLREHHGPVIYVSLGTIYGGWTGYFRRINKAFADSDALVVMTGGGTDLPAKIGPVADNVLVYRYLPQAEVMAAADLCLTHGGFGTVTDAALAGVPLVITPLGGDQFFNAYRLQDLDAAAVVPALHVTPKRMRATATAILDGSRTLTGSADLTESFRTAGGPKLGVARIEAVLNQHH